MSTESTGSDSPSRTPDTDIVSRQERCYTFKELAHGKSVITIEHEGQQYRLLATKNGRLLLNK